MSRIVAMILGVVLVFGGGHASACINDSESTGHEREFRSEYGGLAGFPKSGDVVAKRNDRHDLLVVSGVGLLSASVLLLAKLRAKD